MALGHMDVEQVFNLLEEARRRKGARAARLIKYVPALIELLYPAAEYPGVDQLARAVAVENLLRAALDSMGGHEGQAVAITLGLRPGTLGLNLKQRRALAADLFDVLPRTYERGWREETFFRDMVTELYRLHGANPDAYLPNNSNA